jgi:hypothetical protein
MYSIICVLFVSISNPHQKTMFWSIRMLLVTCVPSLATVNPIMVLLCLWITTLALNILIDVYHFIPMDGNCRFVKIQGFIFCI